MKDAFFYNGAYKAISLTGSEGWTVLNNANTKDSIDHLYSVVAYMYRCVQLRSNAVAAMPFSIYRGQSSVYDFDGATSKDNLPSKLDWLGAWPGMCAKIEAANILGGRAYFERRGGSFSGTTIMLDWMLPHTVLPQYNGVPSGWGMREDASLPYGALLGFWRRDPRTGIPLYLEVADVAYFWMPDYAVEIGPAYNFPGRAVMQNAGVLQSMDLFLEGYFERGLVKAFLGKFKDKVTQDEAERTKAWLSRVMMGLKQAFSTHIIRNDFEIITIGEGIKDLRDNALSQDEKDAIAVGMGVPISKVSPPATGLGDTTSPDDIRFIEDTVIPEVSWIYQQANEQLFNPLGYQIIAHPDQLRVMQADENDRAGAFALYVGNGLSIPAAIAILGIDVPDDVEIESPGIGLQRGQVTEMELAASNREVGGDTEKVLLNGAQISSALQIVDKFATGAIDRETAVNMYDVFLGIDKTVSNSLIPQEKPEKPQESAPESVSKENAPDIFENLQRIEEEKRFKRWLKNGKGYDVAKYETDLLTDEWKIETAIKYIHDTQQTYKATNLDTVINDYTEKLSGLLLTAIDSENPQYHALEIEQLVTAVITEQFKQGALLDNNDLLTPSQQSQLDKIIDTNTNLINKLILDSIEQTKGIALDRLTERSAAIGSRLRSWGNAIREAFNIGRIFTRNEEMKLEWRLGGTEKHCSSCLAQHGKIRTASEWQQLAAVLIYPQSRALECKGYNCDCGMTVVN